MPALNSLGLQGLDLPIGGGCSALTVSLVNNTLATGPLGVVGTSTVIPSIARHRVVMVASVA